MFLGVALALLVVWALGFFIFPVIGVLVHILLVLAIIAIVWHFLADRGSHA